MNVQNSPEAPISNQDGEENDVVQPEQCCFLLQESADHAGTHLPDACRALNIGKSI